MRTVKACLHHDVGWNHWNSNRRTVVAVYDAQLLYGELAAFGDRYQPVEKGRRDPTHHARAAEERDTSISIAPN
jgi:hypothetical protein